MISLFEDLENILKVNIIILQELWKNQYNLTTYQPLKQNFVQIYFRSIKTRICFNIKKNITLLS